MNEVISIPEWRVKGREFRDINNNPIEKGFYIDTQEYYPENSPLYYVEEPGAYFYDHIYRQLFIRARETNTRKLEFMSHGRIIEHKAYNLRPATQKELELRLTQIDRTVSSLQASRKELAELFGQNQQLEQAKSSSPC